MLEEMEVSNCPDKIKGGVLAKSYQTKGPELELERLDWRDRAMWYEFADTRDGSQAAETRWRWLDWGWGRLEERLEVRWFARLEEQPGFEEQPAAWGWLSEIELWTWSNCRGEELMSFAERENIHWSWRWKKLVLWKERATASSVMMISSNFDLKVERGK
jgi:hypothetical protein